MSDPTRDLARFGAAPAAADQLARGDLGLHPNSVDISDPAGVPGETADRGVVSTQISSDFGEGSPGPWGDAGDSVPAQRPARTLGNRGHGVCARWSRPDPNPRPTRVIGGPLMPVNDAAPRAGGRWSVLGVDQVTHTTRGGGVLPGTRMVFTTFAVLTLLAASTLLLLAAHTDRYFAWTITAEPIAAFFGSAYAAGLCAFGAGAAPGPMGPNSGSARHRHDVYGADLDSHADSSTHTPPGIG